MRFATPPGFTWDRLATYPLSRAPDRAAVIDDAGALTFAQVDAQVNRLARALAAAGAKRGDRVALILPNGAPFIVTELAIMRLGCVKVPLNIRFHEKEVLYALADCQPSAVVARADYAAKIRARMGDVPSLRAVVAAGDAAAGCPSYEAIVAAGDAAAGCPSYEAIVAAGDASPVAPAVYADDDPILLRYTGGTTGKPKGIVHTYRSYLAVVLDVVREQQLVEQDVALHIGHLAHGNNFQWPAFYSVGATQVLRERFDARAIWEDFDRHGVTFVYMVPTMIHMLLEGDAGTSRAPKLRMFMYASAPMPVPLLRRAIKRFGNIFTQVYTLSEAPVITTIMRPHEHLEIESDVGPRLASVGREVVSMEIRLVDNDMRDVEQGQPGELAVRSVNNMSAYWNLPEETAKTLVGGWLRTGDVGRRDRDGYITLVDRKKDIIITGGFNVWPKEVESVLHQHESVAQCAVVGAPDEKWGERIVAFVVRKPGKDVTAEALQALCADNLADYKKPRDIRFVDALPVTPVGKISRLDLRARLKGEAS